MDNLGYVEELSGINKKSPPTIENDKTEQIIENAKVYTFEEAIALTGIGNYHYFLEIVTGLSLMGAILELMSVGLVMPFMDDDIPSTPAEKGLLTSASFLGVVLSSHASGFLSDTWGRAKMLRTTLGIGLITSAISAFSVNIWMFIVFKFLTGLVISSSQASVYTYVGEFHGTKTRTRFIALLSIFSPLAIMLAPALALVILPIKLNITLFGMKFGSWRLLMLVNTCMRGVSLIGILITSETPKFLVLQGYHEEALQTLQTMFSVNNRKPKCDYPVQKVSLEMSGCKLNSITGLNDARKLIWNQTYPLFCKGRLPYTLNIMLIMFLLSLIAQGMFLWLPTMLKQQVAQMGTGYTTCEVMTLNQTAVANTTANNDDVPIDNMIFYVLIMIGAVTSVIYYAASYIIDKVGKKNLMFTWVLISAFGCLAFQWITDFSWAVVVYTIMMSMSSCNGIVSTVAMEFFPTNVSGMGMCLIMMVSRFGSFGGSIFVGLIIYTHCDIMFYIYLVICILIAVLCLFLP